MRQLNHISLRHFMFCNHLPGLCYLFLDTSFSLLQVLNQSKFRVDLRFFAELISVGVLPEKAALSTLSSQLNLLINHDKEEHNNISVIQSFCKHCGSDYAGLIPRKFRQVDSAPLLSAGK